MKNMHILKKLLFVIFTFSIGFFISACGYKPSSYYAKKEMEGNVFVKLNVSLEDPKNSVLVKDAVTKLLIQKLDSKLVDKESIADVIMNVAINSVSMQTLQYDTLGYNKLYRAIVVLKIDYFRKDDGIKKSFTVDGEYDFSIDDGTTITETKRFDAISNAANKALDEVLSKIAVSSFR
ncbi:MAG: LPS assembly lipoprotein LptE [Aliarcobacter sp.]|nr:LPS assembly lipoprotein LptE [Aliarcobacter sp.]